VPDLAQFLIAHMDKGLAPKGCRLLQPESVEMMHQVAGSSAGSINSFGLVGQGMGWSLCEDGVEGQVAVNWVSEAPWSSSEPIRAQRES